MKLDSVVLKNFRGYRDEIRIDIGSLTAFIGKNDVGKSSVLDALEIFSTTMLLHVKKMTSQ